LSFVPCRRHSSSSSTSFGRPSSSWR
jgi:hypothetical protein